MPGALAGEPRHLQRLRRHRHRDRAGLKHPRSVAGQVDHPVAASGVGTRCPPAVSVPSDRARSSSAPSHSPVAMPEIPVEAQRLVGVGYEPAGLRPVRHLLLAGDVWSREPWVRPGVAQARHATP